MLKNTNIVYILFFYVKRFYWVLTHQGKFFHVNKNQEKKTLAQNENDTLWFWRENQTFETKYKRSKLR